MRPDCLNKLPPAFREALFNNTWKKRAKKTSFFFNPWIRITSDAIIRWSRRPPFEKTTPLDPRQKLLIKVGQNLQLKKNSMQNMTAHDSWLKRRLQALISCLETNSNEFYNILYFACFVTSTAVLIDIKKLLKVRMAYRSPMLLSYLNCRRL
jgi:hypothetical protein